MTDENHCKNHSRRLISATGNAAIVNTLYINDCIEWLGTAERQWNQRVNAYETPKA